MEVSIRDIVKFLMFVVMIGEVKKCAAKFVNLGDLSDKLDAMLDGQEQDARRSRQFDGRSWIWQDYEFGTGVGNREELFVTNIDTWQDSKVFNDVENWQFLEHEGSNYFAGTNKSTLLLYHFDTKTNYVSLRANLSIHETIRKFKIISLSHSISKTLENNGIYVILSVEAKNKIQYLKWFHFDDRNFVHFWIWSLEKPVKSLEHFSVNDQQKLILLYENDVLFNEVFSLVEIYDIKINGHSSKFRLCDQFLVSETFNLQVCPSREDKTTISLLSKDHVILYEYKDENIVKCIFKQVQNITINGLINTICFESGYVHYLATSGPTSNLFKFYGNEFLYDEEMGKLFHETGNGKFIQSLPVDTYRDEVILLIQLKNLTVIALSWNGSVFKPISLPNQKLNHYDLSKAMIIPNFGFLIGNSFVKFKVKLNKLSRPEENEIQKILETKSAFEDILEKQESIIVKTNLMTEQSYSSHPEINGFFNLAEVEIDELKVNGTNNFPVMLGSHNLTLYDIQSNYVDAAKLISKLNKKIDEIESNLKNALITNNTDTYFHEINISGNLEIKGTLSVKKLAIDKLNEISMDSLMDECERTSNTKITGIKSFPSIQFIDDNLKIKNLNGIPLSNIKFEADSRDYTDIDLSKISKLEIKSSLNFSKISGTDWNDLMKNIVFKNKNKRQIITGSTVISGQLNASHIRLDRLNGLQYPHEYVVKSSPEDADITSAKTFESIQVLNLQDVKTINGIDADEFIILNADQSLEHQITFENLVIDESLQIDGNIVGLPEQDIDPDLTLLNSNIIQSNAMFTNLHVSGNIYVENSINGTDWSKLDDLILKDEEDVIVTGTKTFLGNVHIMDKLQIKTGLINNHSIHDFITLDTRQILPNLSKISGDVKFTDVSYQELKSLEENINSNINEGLPICMKKPFIFTEPPIIDEFSFLYINENITGSDFSQKLESLLKHTSFEHLNAKKLIVDDLVPTVVNGVNFQDFISQKISKTGYQTLPGSVTIKYLEVEKLYTELVNNRSTNDLETLVNKINAFYNDIFSGNMFIDSLNVTGHIITSKINEEDLNDVLDVNFIEQFIFRTNQTIENIVVEGLVNGLNFTKKVDDIVVKTDDHIIIKGPKRMKKLTSKNLRIEHINGHAADDVISGDKNQTLTGPLKIKGSVNVEKLFDSTGKINDVLFKDISEIICKLDDKLYKLTGDFVVHNNTFIKDLNVYGYVHHTDMNEFMENLIFLNENLTEISGEKIFSDSINLANNISITERLNKIDLKTFYQNAVLIDDPVSVSSKVIFETDILVEGDIVVENNLKVGAIKGVNVDNLMENAVYLNRPTFIAETAAFSTAIFKSDITVETWNDVQMDKLISLNKDEVIQDTLMCVDAMVDNLEIRGFVNGANVTELYKNTFTLSTDQNITGAISFLNNIYVNSDFNAQYINNLDISKTISLNDADPLIGNFVFHSPVILQDNLRVFGILNGIDLLNWQSTAVSTFPQIKQSTSGNWTIYGNVSFEKSVHASGSINGIIIQKLSSDVEKQKKEVEFIVETKMTNMRRICEDLKELKDEAENMIYKFKSFEYLRVLEFDNKIASVHHFELNNIDYIMVNFESCHLDVFAFTSEGFVLAANVSNFGYVKQFITLNYKESLYFVSVGKAECGRNSGNLWSLENYQFKYILDLGNVTDVEKLGNDAFAVIVDHQFQEWSIKQICENSFEPINVIPIKDKNVQFFTNENDTLLASRDAIYGLRSEILEFEEYENPFSTNDILTFQTGIYQKEYILFYDERLSDDYVFICNNDLSQRKVLQTITTHKPNSFLIFNFDGFRENLLIYSENKRKIQIYEYRGIEGFKHHSSIKLKHDKLISFKLRMHPYFAKRHCLAVIQDNKLIILKAEMYGEKLNMNKQLTCGAA